MSKKRNSSDLIFYVYIYWDVNNIPRYVGKGQGNRYKSHLRRTVNKELRGWIRNYREKYNRPPEIRFYIQNVTEYEAFNHEEDLIKLIGRLDLGTGPLFNHSDGGEGGSGHICTDEFRRRGSERIKGENNPMYGKTGEKNGFYGHHHTKADLAYMSSLKKNKKRSRVSVEKQIRTMSGENHPLYGTHRTEETKVKCRRTFVIHLLEKNGWNTIFCEELWDEALQIINKRYPDMDRNRKFYKLVKIEVMNLEQLYLKGIKG